jgi:hypothetical protein
VAGFISAKKSTDLSTRIKYLRSTALDKGSMLDS